MEIRSYIGSIKQIQIALLSFLDDDENIEENYHNFEQLLNDQKIRSNKHEFTLIMKIVSKIIKNHHVPDNSYGKLERVILCLKDDMKKFFSDDEIFNFFIGHKRTLLYLISEQIIKVDENLSSILRNDKYKKRKYNIYFFPEIRPFLNKKVETSMSKRCPYDLEKRRLNEENELINLIKKDSLDEFLVYTKKKRMSLSKQIDISVFETNTIFAKENKVSIISYAAFFNSLNIVKYLLDENINKNKSVWIYAIHSNSMEMIKLLENYDFQLNENDYQEFLKESIKCHHNEIAKYILDKFLPNEDFKIVDSYAIKNYNFSFFSKSFENETFLFNLCQCGYYTLIILLLKYSNIDVNNRIVTKPNEKTFLNAAIENYNTDSVQALLTSESIDVNLPSVLYNYRFNII